MRKCILGSSKAHLKAPLKASNHSSNVWTLKFLSLQTFFFTIKFEFHPINFQFYTTTMNLWIMNKLSHGFMLHFSSFFGGSRPTCTQKRNHNGTNREILLHNFFFDCKFATSELWSDGDDVGKLKNVHCHEIRRINQESSQHRKSNVITVVVLSDIIRFFMDREKIRKSERKLWVIKAWEKRNYSRISWNEDNSIFCCVYLVSRNVLLMISFMINEFDLRAFCVTRLHNFHFHSLAQHVLPSFRVGPTSCAPHGWEGSDMIRVNNLIVITKWEPSPHFISDSLSFLHMLCLCHFDCPNHFCVSFL